MERRFASKFEYRDTNARFVERTGCSWNRNCRQSVTEAIGACNGKQCLLQRNAIKSLDPVYRVKKTQ